MSSPRISSGDIRARNPGSERLWVWGLTLFIFLSLPVWAPRIFGPLIDDSWLATLNHFAFDGLQFGTDLVFTYGPLGFLQVPFYYPGTYALQIAFYLLVGSALSIAARDALPSTGREGLGRRSGRPLRARFLSPQARRLSPRDRGGLRLEAMPRPGVRPHGAGHGVPRLPRHRLTGQVDPPGGQPRGGRLRGGGRVAKRPANVQGALGLPGPDGLLLSGQRPAAGESARVPDHEWRAHAGLLGRAGGKRLGPLPHWRQSPAWRPSLSCFGSTCRVDSGTGSCSW